MSVNKYKILFSELTEKKLTIPIEINWDFLGRGMDIDQYEERTSREILNLDKDFEVARFAHSNGTNLQDPYATDINYKFYFVNSAVTSANLAQAKWDSDYRNQGFSAKDIYYFSNSFKKSFFKLDFYDSPYPSGQTNYITIILPTQQGLNLKTDVGFLKGVDIKKSEFKLDFLGDKEGFFIYWLKNKSFLNRSIFYMSAKFFDSKSGIFIKMMNRKQRDLSPTNRFNFRPEEFFYYKVELNYANYTYKVYDFQGVNVGGDDKPILWYEYVNPS